MSHHDSKNAETDKPLSALIPVERMKRDDQASLLKLRGSGRGMWGKNSESTVRRLRSEWGR